jgi:acetyl-CoA acetyltransferase
MKAAMLAHDLLAVGSQDVVVAGGMESMSNAPYLMLKGRGGYRYGHGTLFDHMALDGLEDAYEKTPNGGGKSMGQFAEDCAGKYTFSREEQDRFAIASTERAKAANDAAAKAAKGAEIAATKVAKEAERAAAKAAKEVEHAAAKAAKEAEFRDKLERSAHQENALKDQQRQERRRMIAAACAEERSRQAAELKAKQNQAPNAESRDTRRFVDKFLNDIPFCTCVVSNMPS